MESQAMTGFEINGYPMPPSANNLYSNNPRGGRFKSQKLTAYEVEVTHWSYRYGYQLQSARMCVAALDLGQVFHVERTFYHKGFRILTKDGQPRKNDTSNRFKALDDTLAQLLGIDDSYFWSGTYDKLVSANDALGEYVDLIFTVRAATPEAESGATARLVRQHHV
jgi:Holliday junction resolvase RusA-like endonuclease